MLKPCMAPVFVYFVLSSVFWAQNQGTQNQGNCRAAIDAADKLRASEAAEDQLKALSLYKEALDCLGPAPTQLKAETLMRYSKLQLVLDQYSDASPNLQEALKILQQLPDQNVEIRTDEAWVYGNLGYAWKMLGQFDQAIHNFEEAGRRFEELGDINRIAFTYEQLGLVHSLQGDYQDALNSYDQALKMRDQIAVDIANQQQKDKQLQNDNQQQKAAILDMQGRVYAQLNQYHDAWKNYRKALTLARETHYDKFVGLTLNDIGALRLKQGQPNIAELDHIRAFKELQKHGIADLSLAETQALLADALTAQGKYDLAIQNYHQALEHQEKAGDKIGQAQTHLGLGMLESAKRHWPKAEAQFFLAVKIYCGAGSKVGESTVRFRRAVAFAAQGNDTAAELEVQQAIALAEKVRRFVPGNALKVSYFVTVEQMYRFEIGLLLHEKGTGNQLEAFELFQRAQSRTLLDTLGESIRQDPRFDPFFNIVFATDVEQRILDSDSALVQFYLAEPSSYAWIISQSGVDFVKLPAKQILERDVRLLLQFGVAGQWTGPQQAATDRLRRYLAPVFAAAQKRRWIVVPDGALHFCPFTILTSWGRQGQGPKEIVKIPSVSAIDMIRRTGNAARPAYALAIFADPVFDELDSRVAALNSTQTAVNSHSGIRRSRGHPRDFLPRLRYTRDEARELVRLFPPNQSRSFLAFDATREAAAGQALHDFRIVHLATHSLPDESRPELSKIVFSQVAKDGSPREGDLFAKDIYQMKLSADLVVLSSCRGAIGRQQPGEGPMSLSRAFLFAGSKAVVASLWEINDETTARFMEKFYRHMVKDSLPPAAALAMTQSEFRRNKKLSNPYYWAGFELYGEWMER